MSQHIVPMMTLSRHNNVEVVLIELLKKMKINSSADTVIAELGKHPDYCCFYDRTPPRLGL